MRKTGWVFQRLFPINSCDKPIPCNLISLTVPTVDQPEIALVNDRDEIACLSFYRIWCPDWGLWLETRRIVRRENCPSVRSISVHHDNPVPACLALLGEDGLEKRDLVFSFR